MTKYVCKSYKLSHDKIYVQFLYNYTSKPYISYILTLSPHSCLSIVRSKYDCIGIFSNMALPMIVPNN